MLRVWMDGMYLNAVSRIQRALREERGDTNFISILIILGIVVILAGVFMAFKDKIVDMVEQQVNSFTIH